MLYFILAFYFLVLNREVVVCFKTLELLLVCVFTEAMFAQQHRFKLVPFYILKDQNLRGVGQDLDYQALPDVWLDHSPKRCCVLALPLVKNLGVCYDIGFMA